MLTKQLVVFASMCKYVTLREKEFKTIALKRPVYNTNVTKRSYQDMVKTFDKIVYPEIYTQYQVKQQFFVLNWPYVHLHTAVPSLGPTDTLVPGKQTWLTPSSPRESLSRNCGEMPNHCSSEFRVNMSHNIDNQLTKAGPQ